MINPRPDDHLIDGGNMAEPLGLGYLASSLEIGGFSVDVLDLCVRNLSPRGVADFVMKRKPAVVGLSVYTSSLRESYGIVWGRMLQQTRAS